MTPILRSVCAVLVAMCLAGSVARGEELPLPEIHTLKTPEGVEFAILGEKPSSPAPTLFMFASDMRGTLSGPDSGAIGRILAPQGFVCVSLDVPCHGKDVKEGETGNDLTSWRTRLERGGKLIEPIARDCSLVLDYLIAEKYTDPEKAAISGTSRGGFIALHCAAAEPRFKHVIGFAPVTHLPNLREFSGTANNETVLGLSVIHLTEKLAGRSVWITIGNNDVRVGTKDCVNFVQELTQKSIPKLDPVPVELHLLGTTDHRLHAAPAPQFRQTAAPHKMASEWLTAQQALP